MATAKEIINDVASNPATSFEDILYAALELAAFRERSSVFNPTGQNRVTRTQGDTNNVVFNVTLETQTALSPSNDGSIVTQVIDYLVEPA